MYYVTTPAFGIDRVRAFPTKQAREAYLIAAGGTGARCIDSRTAHTLGERLVISYDHEIPDGVYIINRQYNSSGTLRLIMARKGW